MCMLNPWTEETEEDWDRKKPSSSHKQGVEGTPKVRSTGAGPGAPDSVYWLLFLLLSQSSDKCNLEKERFTLAHSLRAQCLVRAR